MKSSRFFLLLLLLVALAVRSAGLFRGLETNSSFHPDASKQVTATYNFLRGHYLWYTGSLAYDGYPYGLNHVDEWLIRAAWPPIRTVLHALYPAFEFPHVPSIAALYYICRALRVLYSLAAWCLFAWMLSRLVASPARRYAWLLVAALAPIPSIVTHSATGDVGPDLFIMLALAFLVHAKDAPPRTFAFAGCGFALGCAFACKYHGILGALTPALFLPLAPLSWRERFRLGIATAIGVFAGFALLTPHVFIAPEKTLKLIGQNFVYIQHYGIDPGFESLPLHQRLGISLRQNIPIVLDAIGILTMSAAAIALYSVARRMIRMRDRAHAWDFALIAMPFGVLALSLTGKPALQPFHFSFLPLPLLLGIAVVWPQLKPRLLRIALPLVLALIGVEYACKQWRDLSFWVREDTNHLAWHMSKGLVEPPAKSDKLGTVATLVVEGENRAVFRNRPARVRIADAGDWVEFPDDAVPATPWPASHDWIFSNLPAFPRETRLVEISSDETIRRTVISPPTDEVPITFYAGSREAEIRFTYRGKSQHFVVAPLEAYTLVLPATSGVFFARDEFSGRRHSIRVQARGAPALMRVGGEPQTAADPERLTRKLGHARFVDGVCQADESNLVQQLCLLPGLYALEVDAPRETPPMTLLVDDALLHHPDRERRFVLAWSNGVWRTEWQHPRDLLFTDLSLERTDEDNRALPWRIRPVGVLPEQREKTAANAWHPARSFGRGKWTLGNLSWPDQLSRGEPLTIRIQLDAASSAREALSDYAVFLHLLDENKKQVFASDVPLLNIPSRHAGDVPAQQLGVPDLPPGRYEVCMGLYRPRTGIRVKPDGTNLAPDRRAGLGFIQID